MIESDILQPEAADFLAQLQAKQDQREAVNQRAQNLDDLLRWCNSFIESSKEWRKASFEGKWEKYQRYADGIYDPEIAKLKETWQAKAFIPLIPSHRESIHSAIYRTMVGPKPNLEVPARLAADKEQGENVRDLILRELSRTEFNVVFNRVLEDADTFGSGFARVRHEDKVEERLVKNPVFEQVNVLDPSSIIRSMTGRQNVIGYEDAFEPVQIYKGVKIDYLPILDVFPDPKGLEINGHPIAYRYRVNYGDVVRGVSEGYYLPECLERLKDYDETDKKDDEKGIIDANRDIGDSSRELADYEKELVCYEIWARIPKKWVFLDGGPIDDPEKLVPARVLFHPLCVKTVELNKHYDGEAPIYKMDYLPVAGRFYGRGIPEMLSDLQEVANEGVNQRIDVLSRTINDIYAVIEKAVVDSNDFISRPGQMIRLNAKYVQDIRQAFQRVEMGSVDKAAYIDIQEIERYAQERTSANRVTIGTAGQVRDANETLGGMELLRQSASEKFAFIGMLIEQMFLINVYKAVWKEVYAHLDPEYILKSLGPERAMRFVPMSPEEIENDYRMEPQGVFSMESKSRRQAFLMTLYQVFAAEPWFNRIAAFDDVVKSGDLDPTTLKLSPEEMQLMMHAQANLQAANQPLPNRPPEEKKSGSPEQS